MAQLLTKIVQIPYSGISWEEAHLFEHLVLAGFSDYLQGKNINADFLYWIDGRTFEEVVFFDLGFYSKEISDCFDSYLYTLTAFTRDQIDANLLVMGSEDRRHFSVKDYDALAVSLNALSDRMRGLAAKVTKPSASLKTSARKPLDFHEVSLALIFTDILENELKALMRLFILFSEACDQVFREIPGAYIDANSGVEVAKKKAGFTVSYCVPSSTRVSDIKTIHKNIIERVQKVPYENIKTHMQAYAAEPLWKRLSIEYFQQAGVVTTPGEIAKLATEEAVKSLTSKLRIKFYYPED